MKPENWAFIIYMMILLVGLGFSSMMINKFEACKEKGGVLLRGFGYWHCYRAQEIP